MPLLLAFLWSGSFFLSLPLIEPFPLARLGAVGLMALALLVAGWDWLYAKERRPLSAPLPVMLGLLFGWAGLSLLWTPSVYHTGLGLGRFFLLPGSFLLVWLAGSPRLYRYLMAGGAVVVGALALGALAQLFFFPQMLVSGQVRIPFANPNSLAALLALGFFPSLGLMLSGRSGAVRTGALIFCALTLAAVIMLGGRGVLLAAGTALLLFLGLNRQALRGHSRCLGALALVAVAAFIAPYITGGNATLARFAALAGDPGAVTATRTLIWEGTFDMIKTHPLFGTGFETFALFYPQYRLPEDWFSGGFMAHSDPLQFWAELGLPGLFLFYGIGLYCGFLMIKYARAAKSQPAEKQIMVWAVFAGLLTILLHSHISFIFYLAAFLPPAGILLGWWYRQVGPQDKPAAQDGRPGTAALAGYGMALFILVTGLVGQQGLLLSSYYAAQAQNTSLVGEGLQIYAAKANKAHEVGFGLNPRPYLLAVALPLSALEGEGFLLPRAKREELSGQAQSYIDQALSHNPRNADAWYAQARLNRILNEPEKAEEALERALALNPAQADARKMLAHFYLRADQADKAWALYREGLDRAYVTDDPRAYLKGFLVLAEQRGEDALVAKIKKKLAWAEKRFGSSVP